MARIDPWHTVEHPIIYSLSNSWPQVVAFGRFHLCWETEQVQCGIVTQAECFSYLWSIIFASTKCIQPVWAWTSFIYLTDIWWKYDGRKQSNKTFNLCILRGKKREHLILKKHVTLKHILINSWTEGGHISGIYIFYFILQENCLLHWER